MVSEATYDWSIGEGRNAFVGGNVTHHSATNASLGNDPDLRLRAYNTLDVRGRRAGGDGRWALGAFGRNVTNEYHWNNMFRFTDTRIRIAARPVTYGLKLSIRR